jgi:hypothetical protein
LKYTIMQHSRSGDLDGGIAAAVYQGIKDDDFGSSAVDALLSMVLSGETEVLPGVLAHLANKAQPDWAAELCRYVRPS